MLIPLRQPLSLPCTPPGFNPTHIAATNARFSGVADVAVSGFFNLLNGQRGVRTGFTPSGGTDGVIGRYFTTNTSGAYSLFSNAGPASNETVGYTIGAITRMVTNNNAIIFDNDNTFSTAGINYGTSTSNTWLIQSISGGSFKTGLSGLRQIGVPYFSAVSFNSFTTNWVQTNLLTGQIHSATSGSAITVAGISDGNYVVGNGISHAAGGSIAAVMFSGTYLSQTELTYWAQNPWSYWYPDGISADEVGSVSVTPTTTGGSTLQMMGIG